MYSCSRHQEDSKFLMHLMQSQASLRDVLREHENFYLHYQSFIAVADLALSTHACELSIALLVMTPCAIGGLQKFLELK